MGAEPPSCEGSYSPLPRTANVKANRKIRMATMITNARRSRTPSPLVSLVVAPFYTNLDQPFYEKGSLLDGVMYNVATCSSLAPQRIEHKHFRDNRRW